MALSLLVSGGAAAASYAALSDGKGKTRSTQAGLPGAATTPTPITGTPLETAPTVPPAVNTTAPTTAEPTTTEDSGSSDSADSISESSPTTTYSTPSYIPPAPSYSGPSFSAPGSSGSANSSSSARLPETPSSSGGTTSTPADLEPLTSSTIKPGSSSGTTKPGGADGDPDLAEPGWQTFTAAGSKTLDRGSLTDIDDANRAALNDGEADTIWSPTLLADGYDPSYGFSIRIKISEKPVLVSRLQISSGTPGLNLQVSGKAGAAPRGQGSAGLVELGGVKALEPGKATIFKGLDRAKGRKVPIRYLLLHFTGGTPGQKLQLNGLRVRVAR